MDYEVVAEHKTDLQFLKVRLYGTKGKYYKNTAKKKSASNTLEYSFKNKEEGEHKLCITSLNSRSKYVEIYYEIHSNESQEYIQMV